MTLKFLNKMNDISLKKSMAINMAESMFARVGGTPAITALIDLLYSKITVNASTSPFFENKDLARVKAKQVEFFSNALGLA